MTKKLGVKFLVLILLGIFVTGCSSLPPTQDVVAKEKNQTKAERMAQDEEDLSYWD